MDNVTHSLFGLTLARAGFSKRHGRAGTVLLVLSSNLPDVDVLLALTHGEASAWLRRTVTHSVFGAPLLAAALAAAFWWRRRDRTRYAGWLGLALAGVAGHVGLDLVNSYGVVLLAPLRWDRFELAWVFIIDLALTGVLLLPLALERTRLGRPRSHQLALALVGAYLAATGLLRLRAHELVRRELLRDRGMRPTFTYAFPEALGPHRWRVVALEDGATWHAFLAHPLDGRVEEGPVVATDAADPRIEALLRADARARDALAFTMAPVWSIAPDGRTATLTDLRFRSLVLERRGDPFSWTFALPAAAR